MEGYQKPQLVNGEIENSLFNQTHEHSH